MKGFEEECPHCGSPCWTGVNPHCVSPICKWFDAKAHNEYIDLLLEEYSLDLEAPDEEARVPQPTGSAELELDWENEDTDPMFRFKPGDIKWPV